MDLNERAIISFKGKDGTAPAHEWSGTSLRFENPDKTWGAYTNLVGPPGAGSTILAHRSGEKSEPISEIEISQETTSYIDHTGGGKLILHAPSHTHDLNWHFETLADVPDALTRDGAVVYIKSLDQHYYSNGRTWNELKGTGGGTGPTPADDAYYVGKFDSVDALRAAVPSPVLNKSFGFVSDVTNGTNLRYLYYIPKSGMVAGWYVYRMSDSSGFRLDPNPPIRGVNYFEAATEAAAKQARDAYMNNPANAADFQRYKDDSQLMVLLQWPDAATPGNNIIAYQNWHVSEWVDTFGNYTFSFNIGAHSIDELRDGHRVSNLESTVVTAIECIGSHSDIDLCEGLVENNTIKLSKLGTNTAKYLRLSKEPTKSVNVELVHTWHGIFNTISEANLTIPAANRLHLETTIAVKEGVGKYKDYTQLYTWDGNASSWNKLIPSGVIPSDILLDDNVTYESFMGRKLIGGNNIKLRGADNGDLTIHCSFAPVKFVDAASERRNVTELVAGNNIRMAMDWKGVLTVDSIDTVNTISAKVGAQTAYTEITKIDAVSKYATLNGDVLSLPAMTLVNVSGTELAQYKSIRAGNNVTIDVGIGSDEGVLTINAVGGGAVTNPVSAKVGNQVNYTEITKIDVASNFATINGDVLTLPAVNLIDATGSELTQLKSIKAGSNVTIDVGTGPDAGVVTINATGGGSGGGAISAKVGDQTTYTDITKITAASKFATISGGELTLPAIDFADASGTSVTQVKRIKAGANVVIDAGSGAEEGVITINAANGGSSTPVLAKLNTGATKELTQLVIIDSVTGTNTFDDSGKLTVYVKQSGAGQTGLDVTGVDPNNVTVKYSDVNNVKFAGNTVLTQDPDTKQLIVTSVGLIGTLLGKSVSDTDPNVWKPIHKLAVTGDKDLVNIEVDPDSSDPQLHQMNISLKGIITAQTAELLEQDHPAATNANRLAHVTTASQLFYSDGTAWHVYTSRYLPEYVRSLYTRYPDAITGDGSYDPNLNRTTSVAYVDATGCPLPVASRERGILQTFVNTAKLAVQMFFGLDTGSVWHRHKDPASAQAEGTWLDWVQIKGAPELTDANFSVLTPATFKLGAAKEEITAQKPLTWLTIQDPSCNILASANGTLQVKRAGKYKVTVCVHLTADPDTDAASQTTGSDFTFYLKDAKTNADIVTPKVIPGVKTPAAGTGFHGLYPAVIATFDNVNISSDGEFKVWLEVGRSAALTQVYLDSYKNFIAIEPANTGTNQGRTIAMNLKNTLGGISYRQGFEVHVEGHDTIPGSGDQVRVFGAHVNSNQPVEG